MKKESCSKPEVKAAEVCISQCIWSFLIKAVHCNQCRLAVEQLIILLPHQDFVCPFVKDYKESFRLHYFPI